MVIKMIQIKNINKAYEDNKILSDIDLKVEEGEFIAIMGHSGCGKSTLLYCMSGMDQPSSGEVVFDGQNILELSEKEMEKVRLKKMGFIFQKTNFLKNLSIEDNIIFPAFQLGDRPRKQVVKEAQEFMAQMGITEIADRDIRKVSGGQLQRAAICRAMMNHPDILLGDEPTGALNSSATKEVMDLLNEINQKEGTTILLVTHDAKVAARADRIIYLEDGVIRDIYELGKFSVDELKIREEKLRVLGI